MTKYITLLALTFIGASANEVQEETPHKLHAKHEKVSPFYLTLKPMLTSGGTLHEGEDTLSGDNAYGLGIDAGYYLLPRIAVELSTSYSKNSVTETNEHGHQKKANGYYTSAAVNLVYKQPIFDEFALFAKLGYEWENEKINGLNINEDGYGVDYAIGATYELDHHLALLLEYESSTMDSLRGDAYFAGVEYRF